MKIKHLVFKSKEEFINKIDESEMSNYDCHFIFADNCFLEDDKIQLTIKKSFHNSILMGCTTAGEIGSKEILEGTLVLTSVKFKNTVLKKAACLINNSGDSFSAGENLANQLLSKDLKHVYILSDGINVNGSKLIDGFNSILSNHNVNISGGLAADNANFNKTLVADADNNFISNGVTALGFYGDTININTGSYGGWDSFGIDRTVTKSDENVVYEIDGVSALELYKNYLGPLSADLPGSALLFPIEMQENLNSEKLVRTILGVNESNGSITFAGSIPKGSVIRLMRTNIDNVIGGAKTAAKITKSDITEQVKLVLLVSCVGRKLVLTQLTQDEIEAVTSEFEDDVVFTGFYSYGELSKLKNGNSCQLHNQTMTITAISES
jgi:hypothetical protein